MSTIHDDGGTIKSGIGGATSGTVYSSGSDISSGFGAVSPGTINAGADISSGMHGPSHGSSAMSLNPGDTLVVKSVTYRYEGVISKSSGEAEIFLLSKAGKNCVFKFYYPNFKPKDDILKQLALLNHDDIINVLDYGYHHDRFFEIMEYAEGGTLEQYLPIKDSGRIKQIVKETVNAYLYCHNHNIIHKDIKPQNLYFKNADGSDLLIGDFGISSLLESGMSRHLTSQSLTVGYAAPEMYGLGGKVYVGKEVDYYALGITLIHLWEGKSPFDGLGIHAISNLTTSGKINIPDDMPKGIQKLVKGLITVDYTKRWAYDEVQRWLRGEDVPVHFHVTEISYPPYQFSTSEAASTAEELAGFLGKSPDKGKKQLYSNKISAWVNLFNQGLSAELDRIIEDDYPKDQDAGIQKAIYILDPDKPFVKAGKQARTTEELGDVLEDSFGLFVESELANQNHPFYLYLEAHEAKKEADSFRKYFKVFSAKKAFNTIVLELHGRDKLRLKGVNYYSPDELLDADPVDVISMLKDPESWVSMWLEGTEWKEIKNQVAKWLSLGTHDSTTLKYALEKGSPYHFPNGDLAYTLNEFDTQFATQLSDPNFLNKTVNPTGGFVASATYWLDKYANGTTYELRLKKFIENNPTNPLSGKLLEFFAAKLNKDYYLSDIAPIVESSYDKLNVDKGLLDKHHEIIKKLVNAHHDDSLLISFIETKFKNKPTDPVSGQLLELLVNTGINQTTYIDTITPLVELAYKNKIFTDAVLNKHYDVLKHLLKKDFNSELIVNYIASHIGEDIAVTLIREHFSGSASIQIYLTDITPLIEKLLSAKKLNDTDLIAHHEIIKKLQQQNINNSLITDYIKANVKTGIAEELLMEYLYSNVHISHYINTVAPIFEANFANKTLAQLHYDFLLTKLIEDPVNHVYLGYITSHWGQPIAKSMLIEYCNCSIPHDYFEKKVEPLFEKALRENIIDNKVYRKLKLAQVKLIENELKVASKNQVISKILEIKSLMPNHPLVNNLADLIRSNEAGLCLSSVNKYYLDDTLSSKQIKWESSYLEKGKYVTTIKLSGVLKLVAIIFVILAGYSIMWKYNKTKEYNASIRKWDTFFSKGSVNGVVSRETKLRNYNQTEEKLRSGQKIKIIKADYISREDMKPIFFIVEYKKNKWDWFVNSDDVVLDKYPE